VEIKLTTSDLVTVTQAAKSLGCVTMTIYRWVKSGKITGVDVAGFLFIPKTEVKRLQKVRAPGASRELSE
jgi:excisionase family DNA binding protein